MIRSATLTGSPAPSGVTALRKPYVLFIADISDALTAKTGFGLRDWIPDDVVGQWRFSNAAIDLGLPDLDVAAAVAAGAQSVVIGAAPSGGALPPGWVGALSDAAAAGLDIVSGLHSRLRDIPELVAAAARGGSALHDVRHAASPPPIGTGQRRSGKRLLTVGTDCAIGKKYTALAIAREMKSRGWSQQFRATGQTGVMIAGGGIAIDAVVADFIAGAVEALAPAAAADHWDVIEGQGSLFHPSYAGVALGLLHGAQADALVMCHALDRVEIDGCPGFPIPPLNEAIRRNVEAASLTNPAARCVGIAVNTSALDAPAARDAMRRIEDAHGLPCVDPLRWGAAAIVDGLAG